MSDHKRPRWVRVDGTYHLRVTNVEEIDTSHLEKLLQRVEEDHTDFGIHFSKDASKYFRQWLANPSKPLKEGAYCLLSNWFLTNGPARKSTRASHARDLWGALFRHAPQEPLTNWLISNRRVVPDVFDRWWDAEREKTPAPRPTYRDFGEAPNDNVNELQRFAARVRQGQARFRQNLLNLYDKKCAVTGCGPEIILEATHIWPHAKSGINRSDNGLLLRADIHILFDANLLRIHPDTLEVRIDPSLEDTEYWSLNDRVLRQRSDGKRPQREYLQDRWECSNETTGNPQGNR